ncbi:MUT11 [Auxenochlorella protothecoides x Auxenochlorella symbiontica]
MAEASPDTTAPAPPENGPSKATPSRDESISDYAEQSDLPTYTSYQCAHTLTGHTRAVSSVRFSHSGASLASASADGTARVWDADTGSCLHVLQGHSKGLNDVAWAPSDAHLATASDDYTLRLWNAGTGAPLRTLRGHTHFAMCVAFSATGVLLVSGSFDETIVVWDVATGQAIRVIPGHSDPITSVAFSRDVLNPAIVSSSFDGLIRVWAGDTGNCLVSLLATGGPPVSFAAFTPNDKYVLAGRVDGKIVLWNYHTKQPLRTFEGHKNTKFCLQAAFLCLGVEETGSSAPPAAVVCGSEDHHIYVWGVNGSQGGVAPLLGLLRGRAGPDDPGEGHCDVVLSVAAHPHLPVLASCGHERDRSVKIWRHVSLP